MALCQHTCDKHLSECADVTAATVGVMKIGIIEIDFIRLCKDIITLCNGFQCCEDFGAIEILDETVQPFVVVFHIHFNQKLFYVWCIRVGFAYQSNKLFEVLHTSVIDGKDRRDVHFDDGVDRFVESDEIVLFVFEVKGIIAAFDVLTKEECKIKLV